MAGAMRLGEWGAALSTSALETFIQQCLELGIRDFDHADIYGNYSTEADFGEVLKKQPSLRQAMQITTKCGIKMVTERRPEHKIKSYDSGSAHILQSVENSLRALHTDYIDLLLLHRPDFLLNPREVAAAFKLLKDAGKVLHFGVSNYTPSQFNLLNTFTPLVTNQVEASLHHLAPFTDGTLDQCIVKDIVPTAWSPLGGGNIFSQAESEQNQRILKVLNPLKEKYSAGTDQILLAFLAKHPSGIIPVIGTSKIERVKAAKEAMDIQLSHEEWYDLWQASTGKRIA